MKQLVLVDAKNMVFRHHWTHKDLRDERGRPTSVLYGFLNGLLSLAHKLPDAQFSFVWDGDGRTWRHDLLDKVPAVSLEKVARAEKEVASDWMAKQLGSSLNYLNKQIGNKPKPKPTEKEKLEAMAPKEKKERVTGYKENRREMWATDAHQDALSQIPELVTTLRWLGFKQWKVPGLEGDDLLAILAESILEAGWYDKVIIHSTDKDYYQLMPDVRILKRVMDGKLDWVSEDQILIEHGVQCEDWTKLRALTGDPSDNIPRIFRGVGPVNAVRWLKDGLDPSLKMFEDHPTSIRNRYMEFQMGKQVLYIAQRWNEVVRNYQLCQLVTSVSDPRLSNRTRVLTRRELEPLCEDELKRRPLDDWKAKFSDWCVGHQMPTLWGRRDEFDVIP